MVLVDLDAFEVELSSPREEDAAMQPRVLVAA